MFEEVETTSPLCALGFEEYLSDYNKFYTKIYYTDELDAWAAAGVPGPMPGDRREVPSDVQIGPRTFQQVRMSRGRVKMAMNMLTNQRVAIKIMNQKISEADCERGYEQ